MQLISLERARWCLHVPALKSCKSLVAAVWMFFLLRFIPTPFQLKLYPGNTDWSRQMQNTHSPSLYLCE